MTDRIQDLSADLAYMRDLVGAEDQGSRRRSGVLMVSGGLIFSLCSLIVWVAAMGWVEAPPSIFGWAWLVAMAAFVLVLFSQTRGRNGRGGVRSRANGVLWSAVGMSIGVIVLCCAATAYATGSPAVWAMLPSVVFTLYGAGWTVAAALSGERWQSGVALGAFAAAVAIGFLSRSPYVFLAYAAGLFLLAAAPGFVLLRGARVARA